MSKRAAVFITKSPLLDVRVSEDVTSLIRKPRSVNTASDLSADDSDQSSFWIRSKVSKCSLVILVTQDAPGMMKDKKGYGATLN